MKFIVTYTPHFNEQIEEFGPFNTIQDARNFMSKEFNEKYMIAKKTNPKVGWTWSHVLNEPSKIENVGSWKIEKVNE